jgi:hypothetical protein
VRLERTQIRSSSCKGYKEPTPIQERKKDKSRRRAHPYPRSFTLSPFGFRADVSMANEGTKRGLEKPLFHFFLADDAVASPRHCFETLLLKFLMAGDAFPKAIVLVDPREGIIH